MINIEQCNEASRRVEHLDPQLTRIPHIQLRPQIGFLW